MSSLVEDIATFRAGNQERVDFPVDVTYIPGKQEMNVNSGFISVEEYSKAAFKFGLVDQDRQLWDHVNSYTKMKIGMPMQFYSSKARWPKLFYPPVVTLDQFKLWTSRCHFDRDWVFIASLIVWVDGVMCPPLNNADIGRRFAPSQSLRNKLLKGKVVVPQDKLWVLGPDTVDLPEKFCFHVFQMDSSTFTPSNPMYEQFPDKLIKDMTTQNIQIMTRGAVNVLNTVDLDFQNYSLSEVYRVSRMHLLRKVLGLKRVSPTVAISDPLHMYSFPQAPTRSPHLDLTGSIVYTSDGIVYFHMTQKNLTVSSIISKKKQSSVQLESSEGYGSFYIKLPVENQIGSSLDVIPRDVEGQVCIKDLMCVHNCEFPAFKHVFQNGSEEIFKYSVRNGVLHALNEDGRWQPIKFNRCNKVRDVPVICCGELVCVGHENIKYTVSKSGELFLGLSPTTNYVSTGQLPQLTAIYCSDDLPLIQLPKKLQVQKDMCLWWSLVENQNMPKWVPYKKLPVIHPLLEVNPSSCEPAHVDATLIGNDVFIDVDYNNGIVINHMMCPKTALVHLPHLLTQQLILQLWRKYPRLFSVDTGSGYVSPDDVLVEAPQSVILASPRDVFIHFPDTLTMSKLPDELKAAINKSTLYLHNNSTAKATLKNNNGIYEFYGEGAHKLNKLRGLWIELKFATDINTAMCNAFGNPSYIAEGQLFLCGSLNSLCIDSELQCFPFVKFIPALVNHIYECRNDFKSDVSFANEQFSASYFENTHVMESFDEITSWCDSADLIDEGEPYHYLVNQEILQQQALLEGVIPEETVDFLQTTNPGMILNSHPPESMNLLVDDVGGLVPKSSCEESSNQDEGEDDNDDDASDGELDYLLNNDDDVLDIDPSKVQFKQSVNDSSSIDVIDVEKGGELVRYYKSRHKFKYIQLNLFGKMADEIRKIPWVTGKEIEIKTTILDDTHHQGSQTQQFVPVFEHGNLVVAAGLFQRFILPHLNRGSHLFIRYQIRDHWFVTPKPFKFIKDLNFGKPFSQLGRPSLITIPSAIQISLVSMNLEVLSGILLSFMPIVCKYGHSRQLMAVVNKWLYGHEPELQAMSMLLTYCINHVLFKKPGPWLSLLKENAFKWVTWQGTVTGLRWSVDVKTEYHTTAQISGWYLSKWKQKISFIEPIKPKLEKITDVWVFSNGQCVSKLQRVTDFNEVCGDVLKVTNGFKLFLMSIKMFASFYAQTNAVDGLCYYANGEWHTDNVNYIDTLINDWSKCELISSKMRLVLDQFHLTNITYQYASAPCVRNGIPSALNENLDWLKENIFLLWFQIGSMPGVWMSQVLSFTRKKKKIKTTKAICFITTWNDFKSINTIDEIKKFITSLPCMEPLGIMTFQKHLKGKIVKREN